MAGGRARVRHWRGAELRIQKDRQEGCKAPGLSDGARRGFGLGWIGAAGIPRRRAAAWEAGEA